jgi:hypothetical protein
MLTYVHVDRMVVADKCDQGCVTRFPRGNRVTGFCLSHSLCRWWHNMSSDTPRPPLFTLHGSWLHQLTRAEVFDSKGAAEHAASLLQVRPAPVLQL